MWNLILFMLIVWVIYFELFKNIVILGLNRNDVYMKMFLVSCMIVDLLYNKFLFLNYLRELNIKILRVLFIMKYNWFYWIEILLNVWKVIILMWWTIFGYFFFLCFCFNVI